MCVCFSLFSVIILSGDNLLAFIYVTMYTTKRMPFKLHIPKQTNRRMRECTGMRAIMLRVHPMFQTVL